MGSCAYPLAFSDEAMIATRTAQDAGRECERLVLQDVPGGDVAVECLGPRTPCEGDEAVTRRSVRLLVGDVGTRMRLVFVRGERQGVVIAEVEDFLGHSSLSM